MKKKVGVISQSKEMAELMKELYHTLNFDRDIILDENYEADFMERGNNLVRNGAGIIIGRSGGYSLLLGRIGVPLLNLKVTTIDILNCLKKVRPMVKSKKILLVIWSKTFFEPEKWLKEDSKNISVEIFDDADGIYQIINRYKENIDDYVIVGGGIVTSYGKKCGFQCYYVNAVAESAVDILYNANNILDTLEEADYYNELLKMMVESNAEGMLTTNQDGIIEFCNTAAIKLLTNEKGSLSGQHIENISPKLSFMSDGISECISHQEKLITINDRMLAITVNKVLVNQEAYGNLWSIRDTSNIQKLEQRIRFQKNKKGLYAKHHFDDMIVESDYMKELCEEAKLMSQSDNTLILYGESGTGKEVFAQSIHNASHRHSGPFVAINCAALSETILESELFGYEEGAFTGVKKGGKTGLFELSHGGTIFLDEINSISASLQAKLLRVIEEHEVMRLGSDFVIPLDIRIISAANEQLSDKVCIGEFRRDLFYRLNTLELTIPPLRERKEEILPLFNYFLDSSNPHNYKIDKTTQKQLLSYQWPGNIRELRNVAYRFSLFGKVELNHNYFEKKEIKVNAGEVRIDLNEINRIVEKNIIETMIDQGISKNDIASILGISRSTLWSKLK